MDAEGAPEQVARTADITRRNELAYVATAHDHATDGDGRIDAYAEPEFAAQASEAGDIALRVVSEAEVVAFMHFNGVQCAGNDAARELIRSQQGKIAGEGQKQQGIDPSFLQQGYLLFQWCDELGSFLRAKDPGRMRLERHGHGTGFELAGVDYSLA